MSEKVKYLLVGLLVGGLIVFSANLYVSEEKEIVKEVVAPAPVKQNNGKITGYSAPETISFAGELVPLDRPEVLEKLEREIMVNAFWHSNSVILIKRAHKWLPTIDSILAVHDVPADFKYLSVAESGLENVISPSKAVGFWQFLKGTAKDFGLVVTNEIDQRYDPVLSTVAATKYLKKAYEKFGSWTTVAASYNLGMSATNRIIEAQKAESYFDMTMSEEPSRYLFRILALKNMLENPSAFGFDIPADQKYTLPISTTVTITETIPDLHAYAASKNISYFQIRHMNPWIRDYQLPVKSGQKFELKLPVE